MSTTYHENGTSSWRANMIRIGNDMALIFDGDCPTDKGMERVRIRATHWINTSALMFNNARDGIVSEFVVKCDRELNPDPFYHRIAFVVTCNFRNGVEGKGILYTMSGGSSQQDWCARCPIKPAFDPIAAYERAMGIVGPR